MLPVLSPNVDAAPRRRRALRSLLAVLAVFAVVLGLQTPLSAAADPSSTPTISITPLTASTQPSGTAFGYRVSYTCSNVNASPCAEDPVVTIPLGAAADPSWTVTVGANPLITSWSRTGGDLVIRLADLTEGVAGTIGVSITPPNHTTPNGTAWTLVPTMTFSDGTPAATAPGVTSTVTATPLVSVYKRTPQAFYRVGDIVRYAIGWDCPGAIRAVGNENLSSLVIVDTLPAGLTYASSTPAGAVVAGQTVTFTLPADELGERCSKGAGAAVAAEITATVDAGVADGTRLTNAVAATGTSLSGVVVRASDTENITVVSEFPASTVSKIGWGPLVNEEGDGPWDPNFNGYTSATYAGPWLGGDDPDPSLRLNSLAVSDFLIESAYELQVEMPGPGLGMSVVDPMPCTTNAAGANFTSNDPDELCTDPAWHATIVTVDAGDFNEQNGGIPSSFLPQARLTDGSVVDLIAAPVDPDAEILANGPGWRTYTVPAIAVGEVAELIFPRDDAMTNTSVVFSIGGYADADRERGDVLRNIAEVSSYAAGDSEPYAVASSSVGRVFVLEGPQIGVRKGWTAESSEFWINGTVFVGRPIAGDVTVVDRFPDGIEFIGPATVTVQSYETGEFEDLPADVVSAAVDPVTGETVVTARIPADVINGLLVDGHGDRLEIGITLPSEVTFPGDYTNAATISLDDPQVDDSLCLTGEPVEGAAGSDFRCVGTVEFVVNPDPTSDAVRVTKSVRGSEDDSFKSFPAIGYVAPGGGSATYRLGWTNKSQQSVGDLVMYDLLPRVGDTGTVAGTVNQQRGSTFRPTLTGVSALPAGITASYSTSSNPCRPEVLPNAQNPGCANDWTALPASPSAALLQTVTALRFTSTATYAFDQGVSIDLSMTTPPLTSPDEIAWNTVATAQRNLANGQIIPPVESAKVGIAREDYSHISIDKTVDRATAGVGDTLTYTVTAVNDGGRDLTDVTLRDVLPDGVAFVSATGGGVHDDGEVTWTLDEMPLGRLYTFTVTARIVAGEGGTLVNRWGVDGPTPVTPGHPCEDDPTRSCAETQVPSVELTYAKTSDPAPGTMLKPGDTVTYTVTVTNPTQNSSTLGEVTDDMADVLDKAALVTPPTLECAPAANTCGELDVTPGETTFRWSSSPRAPLEGGTSATISYTVQLDDDAVGTLRNVLVEPDITVEHPILEVDKVSDRGDGALVSPGDTVEYTLSIRNSGAVASSTFSVFDDLGDVVGNASLDTASIVVDPAVGAASYDPVSERLTWTGALDAGQTVTVSYRVTVRADAHGELRNVFLDKTVVNPITGALRWNKVDDSDDAALLGGSEWTLRALDAAGQPTGATLTIVDCESAPCGGPDKDAAPGRFLVSGLAQGDHVLVETAAPVGFVLDQTPRVVTVLGTTAVTVLDDIVNHQQGVPVLPFTGGLGVEHLALIAAVLLLVAVLLAAWQVIRRRRTT